MQPSSRWKWDGLEKRKESDAVQRRMLYDLPYRATKAVDGRRWVFREWSARSSGEAVVGKYLF